MQRKDGEGGREGFVVQSLHTTALVILKKRKKNISIAQVVSHSIKKKIK